MIWSPWRGQTLIAEPTKDYVEITLTLTNCYLIARMHALFGTWKCLHISKSGKKRRKSYVNNAWGRVILPDTWVISKKKNKEKKVIASLALAIYAFWDQFYCIEVALYALKTLRCTFGLPLRKGLRQQDKKPLVCALFLPSPWASLAVPWGSVRSTLGNHDV